MLADAAPPKDKPLTIAGAASPLSRNPSCMKRAAIPKKRSIRVLVVDDYAPFRHFVRSALQKLSQLQVIGEASDGMEAVQKAQELGPDLILLDIGLPTLNGIEAARRIREVSPTSKILFVSENRSRVLTEEALRSGADGAATS